MRLCTAGQKQVSNDYKLSLQASSVHLQGQPFLKPHLKQQPALSLLHQRRHSQRALPAAFLRALKLLLTPTRVQKSPQKKRRPHRRAVLKKPTLKPLKKPPSLRRKPPALRAALKTYLTQSLKATPKVLLLATLRVSLRALQRLLQKSSPLSCVLLRPQAQKRP